MTTRTGLPVPIVSIVDEGLGHSSYVVGLGDGTALVVDPARFPDRQRRAAAERGWRIAWTADTHSHADYISGSPELAADGAVFLASAGAHLEVEHRPVEAGETVDLAAGVTLRAIATPGHTPDHLAYLLLVDGTPEALFTGGSLMVGAVGRTDLLGDEHREELARAMFRGAPRGDPHAARRPRRLPDAWCRVVLLGPFGLRADDDHRYRTGHQPAPEHRRRRPLRRHPARRPRQLPHLLPSAARDQPARPPPLPRAPHPRPARPRHGPSSHRRRCRRRRRPADRRVRGRARARARCRSSTGACSAAGSAGSSPSIVPSCSSSTRTRTGPTWSASASLSVTTGLLGELDGGIDAWTAAGLPVESIPMVTADHMTGTVLDIRQDERVARRPHPRRGARRARRPRHCHRVPAGPLTVMCGHGERAMSGASILDGGRTRATSRVLAGGPEDWHTATGTDLETA